MINMKKILLSFIAFCALPVLQVAAASHAEECSDESSAKQREVRFNLIQVSDVHGNFFPFDFIRRRDMSGSLARVHTFVQERRNEYGDRNVIFMDNGDLLQGQPTAYYYNFIDTLSTNLAIDMLNFMGCNAGNIGNHDVETGLNVFRRAISQCEFPVLGANIINTATGEVDSQIKPYIVIEHDGVRIAILGMVTPAIPVWLSENLWRGLRFDDMEETARKWIPIIRAKEKPHLIVGLFHAGNNLALLGGKYRDNASCEVARNIPGFDIILTGHDHLRTCRTVQNILGENVWVVNPSNNARLVGDIEITLQMKGDKLLSKHIDARLTSMDNYPVSGPFMEYFKQPYNEVKKFVSKKLGNITRTITTRNAYFGPSAFIDLIHSLQLAISGAEISLAAPLSFNAEIEAGDIHVSDMFSLYQYENMLYTMRLSGKEIKDALEMSYERWTNRMYSADDHLLLLSAEYPQDGNERPRLKNSSFNFDSAAGIHYTVDVTKPAGEKITIISMADGTPFQFNRFYRVAVNSYRGNGGGELLTLGAGISQEELTKRIISSTDKDLRYYFMQYIEGLGILHPEPLNHWKFIPEEWVRPAAERDYQLLFGK